MSGSYCYRYPHPAVTTDIVVLMIFDACLHALLIERGSPPFQGSWALPGGFLEPDEDLDNCAARELEEETGLSGVSLEQLQAFSRPDRDPRERVVSVAYLALIAPPQARVRAASDAARAAWHPLDELPPLAFDHADIIAVVRQRLRGRPDHSRYVFELLPDTFTIGELHRAYELLLSEPRDQRRFRNWALSGRLIEYSGADRHCDPHPPMRLYRARRPRRPSDPGRTGATP